MHMYVMAAQCLAAVGTGNNFTAAISLLSEPLYQGACRLCRWHPCFHPSAIAYARAWTSGAFLRALPERLAGLGLQPDPAYAHTVAVHVRCSADVPYTRHPFYHLPAPSYWRWALTRLRQATPHRIAVVHHDARWNGAKGLTSSLRDRIGACEAYAAGICRALEREGFRASLARELSEPLSALKAMLGSAAVLATSASSFSFLPGLAKLHMSDGLERKSRLATGDAPTTTARAVHQPARFITPLYYTEVGALDAFYAAFPKGMPRARLGARERCQQPIHQNLSDAVPWAMHDAWPVRHAVVDAAGHGYLGTVRSYARALAKSSEAIAAWQVKSHRGK